MKSLSPPAASTRAWRGCSSTPDVGVLWARLRTENSATNELVRLPPSGPPAHLVNWRTRTPIEGFAGDDEAVLFIKANGARIVLVDVQVEAGGRYPLGFLGGSGGDPQSPSLGRDYCLIYIEGARIDGDEAEHFPVRFRHRDRGRRYDLLAPALAPPVDPLVEIDVRVGNLPCAPPQFDRRGFIGGRIAAERKRHGPHIILSGRNRLAPLRHALTPHSPLARFRAACGSSTT